MTLAEETNAAAKHYLATARGVGMVPPFYAETASTKCDASWPLWIVRNKTCNSLGLFFSKEDAEALANAMNELS